MHKIIIILFLMITNQTLAQKAITIKKTFSRETRISIDIEASATTIWKLLTDSDHFNEWNSTITSLEGKIEEGEKIRLKSILDEKRTFKLKVKELIFESKMVWGDSKGERTHTLRENTNGSVRFEMSEKIGGLMFPMYAKYIPPFDEVFEQYALDLKDRAEYTEKSR